MLPILPELEVVVVTGFASEVVSPSPVVPVDAPPKSFTISLSVRARCANLFRLPFSSCSVCFIVVFIVQMFWLFVMFKKLR